MENFSITWYIIAFIILLFLVIYLIYSVIDQKRHIESNADYSLTPWWVKTTLWTVHRRNLAVKGLVGCYVSLLIIIIVRYPFENIYPVEVVFIAFILLIILAYHFSIRWMDRHNTWAKEKNVNPA